MAACRMPPMPSAAAPMASGPTDGANVAAVPVVPHRKAAASTAKMPVREPRFTVPPASARRWPVRALGVPGCPRALPVRRLLRGGS